jgi:heterodisulfide reductase subunit A
LDEEKPRVGVYVCHCGHNIAGVINCENLADEASKRSEVVLGKDNMYMCADQGQELVKNDIKEHKLDRVIVAACSPRMHEHTFRRCVSEAGLNPYLFEMANIREFCTWCHSKQKEEAYDKAVDLVDMALEKAKRLKPLDVIKVPVTKNALIIGGGVAGIHAALDLADMGFKVYLVERSPSIGGRMAMLDKTFPTLDCSICILGRRWLTFPITPILSCSLGLRSRA